MSYPVSNLMNTYSNQASVADSKENNQNQNNLDRFDSGALKVAQVVADRSDHFFSQSSEAAKGPEQVALSTKLKKAASKKPGDKKKVNWTEKQIAKLIKRRAEKANETVKNLCPEFNYTARQLQNKIGVLRKLYKTNSKALDGYVGQEGLTKDLLEQFIKMVPNKPVDKKRATWTFANIVKLIQLKVDNPGIATRKVVEAFNNQYDEVQINNQISRLNSEYRRKTNYIDKCIQNGGLSKELLEQFVKATSRKVSSKGKTKWSINEVAKLIKHKVKNQAQSSTPEGWDRERVASKLFKLYGKCRENNPDLNGYIGYEGLTEEDLTIFKKQALKSKYPKKVTWSDKDTAKLIKLRAENLEKMHREFIPNFEGRHNETQIRNQIRFLYEEYRRDEKALDKYVGREGLTKELLEQFKKTIPKKRGTWSDEETAKLIRLKVENLGGENQGQVSDFESKDKKQMSHKLSRLYLECQAKSKALDRYVGKAGLTEELLEQFKKLVPKKKISWSDEETAKLIRLKAENPERKSQDLVLEFNGYTEKQIKFRLKNLRRMYRNKNSALGKYAGKAGLTEALLGKFIDTIPEIKKSKHLTS